MKQPQQAIKTKRKKTPVATTPQSYSMEALHQRVAQRAYEIYQQRMRQGALDDWLQAEQEIVQDRPHRGGYAGVEQE